MAILSKIRERTTVLIAIVGLALFAFVANPKDILDFFNSSKVNSVGEINGETISRREFATKVEAYKSNAGNGVSDIQAVNAVWNNLVSQKVYKKQLEAAGIVVGEKDIWDAIIKIPNIQNAEIFKNEIGLFDEEKFKEYISNLEETSKENKSSAWASWLETENSVKSNLERTAYTQLVRLGIGASLKDGKRGHLEKETKLSGSYVYVPYTTINDSLVNVSTEEVEAYVKKHESEFSEEANRDIKYVKFTKVASLADEGEFKADLAELIDGFSKTTSNEEFIEDNNGTDLPLDANFLYENNLPTIIADKVMSGKEGDVVGPYKFQGHYKISKISKFMQMPDSVKASHILVTFAGSRAADQTVTRTRDEAQKLADSILKVVKKRTSKFTALAKEFSGDRSNADKGGSLDWFTYNRMVPEFRDYTFQNKKGDIGVVETAFGFHVIKIENQKNIQKTVQLATIARKIEASEATENELFENAETLTYNLTSGKDYDELIKASNYVSKPMVGIKELEENISGLGKNRGIVRWIFDEDTKVNQAKRFDLSDGYAVVVLTKKAKKGLTPASKAAIKVKPILIKEKKAALIAEKMNGADLAAIATATDESVRTFSNLTLAAPTISGVGTEPAVVGAIYALETGKVANKISGEKGVFAVQVSNKVAPKELASYEGNRNILAKEYQSKALGKVYDAIKDLSEVKDDRANLY